MINHRAWDGYGIITIVNRLCNSCLLNVLEDINLLYGDKKKH